MSEEKKEMPQAAELKPCPFCNGGETRIHESHLSPTMKGPGAVISATVKHWCPTPKGQPTGLHVSMYGRDKAAAIAAWNRRSPPSPSGRDEIRREALEEAAQVAELAHMVPPDGGSPTEDERRVAEAAASAIRSLMGNKQDLGSGFALGGLGETPSDALEAARRILDVVDDAERTYYPFHTRDYETIARALLAASPSPWREMEAEGFKSLGLASTINGPCVRIDFDTTREAEKFMADLRPFLPEPPSEGLNAGPPEAEGRRTTPSPPSEGGGK